MWHLLRYCEALMTVDTATHVQEPILSDKPRKSPREIFCKPYRKPAATRDSRLPRGKVPNLLHSQAHRLPLRGTTFDWMGSQDWASRKIQNRLPVFNPQNVGKSRFRFTVLTVRNVATKNMLCDRKSRYMTSVESCFGVNWLFLVIFSWFFLLFCFHCSIFLSKICTFSRYIQLFRWYFRRPVFATAQLKTRP